MSKVGRPLLGAILLLATSHSALGGAWRQAPASGQAYASLSYLQADSYSDALGHKHELSLQQAALTIYGSYGVFRDIAVGGTVSPHQLFITDERTLTGNSDLEIWVDHHLASHQAWQFALRYGAVFPIGQENPAWASDLYAIRSQGALGIGILPLLGYSHSGLWMQVGAGIQLRGKGLVSQGRFQADMGGSLYRPWLSGHIGIAGLIPLDRKSNDKPSDQEQYLGGHIAIESKLRKGLKLGLQYDTMIPPGQALPQGPRYNAYFGWAWDDAASRNSK